MMKRIVWCVLLSVMLGGCSLVALQTERFANNFSAAVTDNDDPEGIAVALPSYLLMMDALVRNNPGQADIWQAAATLNAAYAGAFVMDEARARALHDKALRYAFTGLCLKQRALCHPRELTAEQLAIQLQVARKQDVPALYAAGSVWAGWIQAHADDWNAVADLARVELLMKRILQLDEGYQHGAAHLYLGVLDTVLTPALGGRPEEGRAHFEKAIALSAGHNLMAKYYFAKNYARGVFDRDLHDRLLNEVLAADPHAEGFTLSNILAQRQARDLLKSADDFF